MKRLLICPTGRHIDSYLSVATYQLATGPYRDQIDLTQVWALLIPGVSPNRGLLLHKSTPLGSDKIMCLSFPLRPSQLLTSGGRERRSTE